MNYFLGKVLDFWWVFKEDGREILMKVLLFIEVVVGFLKDGVIECEIVGVFWDYVDRFLLFCDYIYKE